MTNKIRLKFVEKKGGAGSGHHGHAGRPGKVGGSTNNSNYHGYSDPKTYYENVLKPKYDAAIRKSNVVVGKAVKVHAGMYILTTSEGIVWEIDHLDEGSNRGSWIARVHGGNDYLDPTNTLQESIDALNGF
jgi:hypothetical protein